ncbi:MAG: helix-turn-helix transcriptional regulator [Euryarchaeota archaeon]|nr:helix-turn-helix transcriptional regulator [Euryarchaeota archaeon]
MSVFDSRGLLSFLLLWLLQKRPMYGNQLAEELERRRGVRPNPGTLYPALRMLERRGLITSRDEDGKKVCFITALGKRQFSFACDRFCSTFGDIVEERKSPARRVSPKTVKRSRVQH